MTEFLQNRKSDLQYALRTMGKNPGVSAAAILSPALGIGANTAIFTLVDAVLLKILSGEESARALHGHLGREKSRRLELP